MSTSSDMILDRINRCRLIKGNYDLIETDLQRCTADPIYFVNNYIWTYDPRLTDTRTIPFRLFPRQILYILWLCERLNSNTSGVVVKPRDIGCTWANAAFALWLFLFRPGVSIGFSSRKLKYVDEKGNLDSIFGKIRLALELLPPWIKPRVEEKVGLIQNLSNESVIKGEGGDGVGRGGRSRIYFLDEFANCDHQDQIDHAVSANSECLIYCSTFTSPGNRFYQLATEGKISRFDFKWQDDLRKDSQWFQMISDTKDPIYVSREILCDPYASLEGALLKKEWIESAKELYKRLTINDSSIPVYAGFDPAGNGRCQNVLMKRQGPKVIEIQSWQYGDVQDSANRALMLSQGCDCFFYDAAGGWGESVGAVFRRQDEIKVYPVYGSGTSGSTHKFVNARAALYWSLKCRFEKSYRLMRGDKGINPGDTIAIPDDGRLIEQLLSIKIKEREDGKVQIESKKSMLERGIVSPDKADALMYAFASDVYKTGSNFV